MITGEKRLLQKSKNFRKCADIHILKVGLKRICLPALVYYSRDAGGEDILRLCLPYVSG